MTDKKLEEYFSKQSTISINVVKLDGKKLNKTIFNQLLIKTPFTSVYEIKTNVTFLGFVSTDEKYLIWGDGNNIYRVKLNDILKLSQINLENGVLYDLTSCYDKNEIEHSIQSVSNQGYVDLYGEEKISDNISQELISEIKDKQKFLKEFYKEVLNHQIFL